MAAFVLVDPETSSDADNKEEYSIIPFEYNESHAIKKISIGHVYKQRFNFLKGDKIMTVEKNLSIDKNKDLYLLSRDDIRSYRSKYKFLHIGLVQFSIDAGSCFYIGTYPPMSVSLRDSKYPNLEDSILVSLESDVRKGVVKFNCFPNFLTPLSDLANSNALVVTIDPSNAASMKVRYRVCYKLMKKSPKPDYLFQNPVLEVDTERTNVVVPKSNN